ncbi:hypothetical protein ACQKWADRAFT_304049 [Trichoderma austrokoningii]
MPYILEYLSALPRGGTVVILHAISAWVFAVLQAQTFLKQNASVRNSMLLRFFLILSICCSCATIILYPHAETIV